MAQKMKTLYIVGVDSTPLWIIKKLAAKKGMEGFRKVLEKGRMEDLESTLLPVTAAAWPTIYTGLEPKDHGTPEFFTITKDHVLDVTFFDPGRSRPFYYDLAKAGFKCLVITPAMDVSMPPADVARNLDIITGFPLKGRPSNNMLKAAMEKHRFFGEPDIEKKIQKKQLPKSAAVGQYADAVRKRASLAKELIEKNHYDLVFVCFTETDRIQHFFLNDADEWKYLLPVYSEASAFVSYVTDKIDKEGGRMIILSDHGAQKVEKEFLANAWLSSKGYAKIKNISEESKPAQHKNSIRQSLRTALFNSRLRDLYEHMPYHAKKIAFGIFATFLPAAEEDGFVRILPSDFEMQSTKAFCAVSVLPVSSIWINDGRFANGSVSGNEAEKIKKQIIADLSRIKDEKGNNLITKVVDGKKYYGSKTRFIPADILFEVREGYNIDPYHFSRSTVFMEPKETSITNHTKRGIFGAYPGKGASAKKGLSVIDMHDMIMQYFGEK